MQPVIYRSHKRDITIALSLEHELRQVYNSW